METEPTNPEEKKSLLKWCIIIFALVVGLRGFYWYVLANYNFINKEDWENRGLFGDMFGGINSLFSGLAFVGVIFAILMQRIELRLQREELKLQREVMNAQVEDSRALVNQTSKQSEIMENQFKLEHTPKFVCTDPSATTGGPICKVEIEIANVGGKAVNLFVKEVSEGNKVHRQPNILVRKEERAFIKIEHKGNILDKKISFVFGYENLLGTIYRFQCHYDHQNFKREDFFSNKLRDLDRDYLIRRMESE